LVFAQDTTAIQTQELVQDSILLNDSLTTEVLGIDSNNLLNEIKKEKTMDFSNFSSVMSIIAGAMTFVSYKTPDDQPFAYLENGLNILEIKVEEKVKIENSSK
jgi:hypothetical protein